MQREISSIIDEVADELHAQGKIRDLHAGLGFLHRFTALHAQCAEISGIVFRRFQFPRPSPRRPEAGRAFFELLTCDPLMSIMEQLFRSPELFASGVYRLRPKLPGKDEGIVPWHQDQCFFLPCSDARPSPTDWSELPPVVTAWVPLMDATPETGCMQMLAPAQAKLHRHYLANVRAFAAGSSPTTIHPDHFPQEARAVTVPAMLGDVLVFSAYTPHRSTANTSGVMRWAADLRYNVPAAGDYYPFEGGFLARSAREPGAVVADYREYARRRRAHRPPERRVVGGRYAALRPWKPAKDETFARPTERQQFEGSLEFEGRVALHRDPARL